MLSLAEFDLLVWKSGKSLYTLYCYTVYDLFVGSTGKLEYL